MRGAALVMVERTASTGEEPLVFLASGDEEEEEEEEEEELPNLRFLMEETRNDIFGWGGGTGLQIKVPRCLGQDS